jgi:dihydrofolate synthase / folylpolyglutamate synthase
MSYAAAVGHLYSLGLELAPTSPTAPRPKFDLDLMRVFAAGLGNPQKSFPSVLIAGTNGKGSTSATLSSILTAAGYRTGLYTSPHLSRINERVQIDGVQISDDDFARLYFHIDEVAQSLVREGRLPHHPSFFEIVTALGFLYFAEQKIDIAVLEVGLGGRLDATNIVEPVVSIITDIALDHQDYLGNTIAEIAREKAGILRERGTLVTLPQHPEANQSIGEVAVALGVHAINAAPYVPGMPETKPGLPVNRYTVMLGGEPLKVDSPLLGAHQQRNLALAIATAEELRNPTGYDLDKSNRLSYKMTNQQIEAGVRNTRWPGRLELIPSTDGASQLLDVAHNPAGAWTLRAAIARLPEEQPRTLIFSCLRDKDVREMMQILLPLFDSSADRPQDHILLAPIENNPRAASVEQLTAAAAELNIPAQAVSTLPDALAQAKVLTPRDGIIIVTGSLYLVGAFRSLVVSEATQSA